jgi:hypothetical protein
MKPFIDDRIARFVHASESRILEFLDRLVSQESPTACKADVDRVGEILAAEMPRGFTLERAVQ